MVFLSAENVYSVNWWAAGAILCCTILLLWWGYQWTVGKDKEEMY